MKSVSKITCTTILAVSLALSPVIATVSVSGTAAAASSTANALKPYTGTKLKTFMISSKSYVLVKDVFFQYDSNDKNLYFTLNVYNGDSQSLDFMDYWIEVHSATGAKFSIQSITPNKKSIIAPKTTEELTFLAKVDPKLNYTDLVFKLVKWDFSMPNYTRAIGQTRVTKNYVNYVPSSHYFMIRKGNEVLKTYLSKGTVFQFDGQKQVTADFVIENAGNFPYVIPELKYYMKTKSGQIIPLNADLSANERTINAGDKKILTLRGIAQSGLDLNGTQVIMAQVDAESKLEIPRGIYNLVWHAQGGFLTTQNQTAEMSVQGTKVDVKVENIYSEMSDTQNQVTLTLKLTNKDKKALSLPKYNFELVTASGSHYPITFPDGAIELIPGIERELIGTSSVPVSSDDNLTLLIRKAKEESNPLEYVAAAFKLSGSQALDAVSSKIYRSTRGTYEISIERTERLPWGNDDILNAIVEVKNIGKASQSVPKIFAALRLNGLTINEADVKLIPLGNSSMIAPSDSTAFAISTKVPYTQEFNDLTLSLTEQVNDQTKQTIGLFKTTSIQAPPARNIMNYDLEYAGRKAVLQFESTYVYEGKDTDLFYGEFTYTNNESRYNILPVLKGYLVTADGQYIDATVQNVKASVKPNGKAKLVVSARIPKTIAHDGTLRFIIGEAVTDGKYSTPEQTPDRFINAVSMNMPKKQNDPKDNLDAFELKPYNLSILKSLAMVSGSSELKLELEYNLSKNTSYDVMESGRKLYVEVTNGRDAYGKSVELETQNSDGFVLGDNKKIIIPLSGEQIGTLVYSGYILNVYDELDGHKRLLGSKRFGAFQLMQ